MTPLRRLALLTAACAATIAVSAPAAQAVTRYASPTGVGTGQCLDEATACSIHRATQGLAGTTEAVLLPGTYETTSTVFAPGVNVHGKAGEPAPLINNTAGGAAVQVYSGGRLADVRINKTAGTFGALWLMDTSVVERVHSRVSTSFGAACFQSGGTLRDSACLATGPNGQGVAASIAGGPGSYSIKLRNVTAVATGTGSEGVAFSSGGEGVGITADLMSVIAQGGEFDVQAANCNNGTGVAVTLVNSNYSTVSTPSTGGCQPGSVTAPGSVGNQTAEPQLEDVASGDLRQRPASPTIDTGTVDGLSGGTDLDRGKRPRGLANDIGAYEYVVPIPQFIGTTPASPADDNTPLIIGSNGAEGPVKLYAGPDCAGEPIAEGSGDAFADGFEVTVADNSVTTYSARAFDPYGHPSDCTPDPISYSEVTPQLADKPDAGDRAEAGTVAAKKCKPRKKGKKKRCKKRKKR